MKRQLPLRKRVALAYGLVGMVLSLCFGVATGFIVADYEVFMLEAMLEGQSRHFIEELERNPDAELPRSPAFSVYREAEAPEGLRNLPEGVFDLEDQKDMHVAAYGPPGQRVVLMIDIGRVERLEEYLLQLFLLILAVGVVVSAWLGWVLSGRTVAPVLQLADAVDALPVTPVQTRLAETMSRDEIGRLAGAIDRYQARLADADASERAFFADASHELRTPIAVIQGAVEVMRDDTEASAAQRARLARMERGLAELGGLLEALLLSARGLPPQRDSIHLAEDCRRALQRLDIPGLDAPRRIRLEGEGPTALAAPQRWVDGILLVLFQRLLVSSAQTEWLGQLDADGLLLRPAQATAAGSGSGARSDLGLGLVFVERLCRALGWRLERGEGDAGLQVRLRIPPGA
ncbi:histidine kinase dimerization/phospho-acceptor domain-containing protein [Arenimonas terrae]|uniref:histidine kinase n=1 Tax=Arenimonas terrae TaxID=2546226 RepID=A0A5C4RXI6_9GAMM|nr:histidine kinase dimerization/phospho-acceptor domain-containing protein [Arenimonas terrae]TNJ35725.1 HAMP domain-containing protein [Arenimonas terrae]